MVVKKLPKHHFYILIFFLLFCLGVSVHYQSRAFIIGYVVALIFMLLAHNTFLAKKATWGIIISFIFLLSYILVFHFKTGSSYGRIFIYKISWDIFKNHWFYGIGWGKFQLEYGLQQAKHFAAGHYTTNELLLADNTYYAFNDYWQFIVETGIKGVVIMIAMLIFLFIFIIKTLYNNGARFGLLLAISQVLVLMTVALFTHIFEKPIVHFIFLGLLLVIILHLKSNKRFSNILPLLVFSILFLTVFRADLLPQLGYSTSFADWGDANKLSRIGYHNKALAKYQASYNRLKIYPAFLEDYSGSLIYIGKYDKAIDLLSQAIEQRSSSTLYLKLAHCFWQTGNLKKAEQAYIMAIQMVPNRFQSRYALFKFYKDTEQKEKAYKCAEELLVLPIKIPSVQVNHIKAIVKNQKENLIAPLD